MATHLQDLRLGRSGISDKEDVDVSPVPRSSSSSTLGDALVRSTKELKEDTLLDVVHLPNTRRQTAGEILVDILSTTNLDHPLLELGLRARLANLLTLSIEVHLLLLLGTILALLVLSANADDAPPVVGGASRAVDAHAPLVRLLDVNDVEVGFEKRLDDALLGVEAYGDRAEDTGEVDAVSGLDEVDELVVEAEGDGVGGLSIGNGVCRSRSSQAWFSSIRRESGTYRESPAA
jgi:hypothetical protein